MAKYTITCACGHEHTFSLVGPHKSREWYLEKAKDEDCPACKEESRKAAIEFENKVAAEKSAEMELPELEGSPKQIAWANTLRITFIDIMEKKMSKVKPEYADMFQRFYEMITSETSAKFFIDTRDENISELFRKFVEEHKDEKVKVEIKEETTETVKTAETVKPGTAEIVIEKETIKAIYMRDSDFIAVVKALEFKWNGKCWTKNITKYNSGINRAIELGHKLLKAGFAVNADKKLVPDMISGTYEEERHNWIDAEENIIVITWEKYTSVSEGNYQEAKKIHGAKYKNKKMVVPAESFDEIRDFAEVNGFRITEEAEELMKKAEEARNNIATVEVTDHKEEKIMSKEEILNAKMADDEIITDLLDEEEETDIDRINKLGYSIVKGMTVGSKLTQDVQGRAVSVWTPSGELKTIHADFDKEITFGGEVKIKLRELVKFAYGYGDKKLTEVERRLTDEQVKEFRVMMDKIGLKKICESVQDGDVPEDFTELDVSHFVKGNTGIKVCAGADEWATYTYEFDHEPTIASIDEAFNIEFQMIDAKMNYKV